MGSSIIEYVNMSIVNDLQGNIDFNNSNEGNINFYKGQVVEGFE